jgi:predicted alpha-1,6-mannanase (GH76 family)
MKAILLLAGLFMFVSVASCNKKSSSNPDPVTPPVIPPISTTVSWAEVADNAQAALTTQYWSVTNRYFYQNNDGNSGFNYWWNAHALDVLVDGYNRTHNSKYLTQMQNLMAGVKAKNNNTMQNTFYDDMEWMSLAALRAYAATNDVFYKTTAVQLWEWIKPGWTTVNNGGIMWASGSPNSKNACSNAPAAIIAARMYQLDKNPDDLAWAKKIYDWQKTYLIDATRGLVWDGYGNKNEGNIYTYNQGTYIGAGVELYKITKEIAYRDEAVRNADYIIGNQLKFSPNGILKGENTGDGGLFKGIFIRYLSQLIIYGDLDNKATRKPEYVFGPDWVTLPSGNVSDCSVHLSGLMLFETLDELKRLNLLTN